MMPKLFLLENRKKVGSKKEEEEEKEKFANLAQSLKKAKAIIVLTRVSVRLSPFDFLQMGRAF